MQASRLARWPMQATCCLCDSEAGTGKLAIASLQRLDKVCLPMHFSVQIYDVERKDDGLELRWTEVLRSKVATAISELSPLIGKEAQKPWAVEAYLKHGLNVKGLTYEDVRGLLRGYQRCACTHIA